MLLSNLRTRWLIIISVMVIAGILIVPNFMENKIEVTAQNQYINFTETVKVEGGTEASEKAEAKQGSELTAKVEPGSYTFKQLLGQVKVALEAAGNQSYIVEGDGKSRKVTISSTDEFALLGLSGMNATNTLLPTLGFGKLDYKQAASYRCDKSAGKEMWWPSKSTIVPGLDIQGGLHLVMGVDSESTMNEKITRMQSVFKQELTDEGVQVQKVERKDGDNRELVFTFESASELPRFKKYIDDFYPNELQVVDEAGSVATVRYFEARVEQLKTQVVNQAIEVIRNRIDSLGTLEPNITAQGTDRIVVQLPGIDDSASAKELINRTARLVFRIVVSEEEVLAELPTLIKDAEAQGGYFLGEGGLKYTDYIKRLNNDLKDKLPKDTRVVFQKNENAVSLAAGRFPMLVKTDTGIDGGELEDAYVRPDQFGRPEVIFRLTPGGRRKFADITEKNINKQMAIVLDDVVQSAPNIQDRIDSATAQITMGGGENREETLKEANIIATTLRAGALPASLQQLEERTVGPTLGADAIAAGQIAGVIGLVLILLFMLVYYKTLGVVANIALITNMVLIFAALSALGATLTLPGVAGIVLTIGMAVDANVIIFERIKEELAKGSGTMAAIKDGFGHAFSAIFDANVTTAAVCVVLMYYGTGPVRGFAVTLMVGIFTSMFTAIFVSRVVLETMVLKFGVSKIADVKAS